MLIGRIFSKYVCLVCVCVCACVQAFKKKTHKKNKKKTKKTKKQKNKQKIKKLKDGVNNDIKFPRKTKKQCSIKLESFFKECLQSDPNQRITVKKALKHPWMMAHS